MTPSKNNKHDTSSKSPLSKSSPDQTPPIRGKTPLSKPLQSTSPNPSHLTPTARKPSNAASPQQVRKVSATPQPNQPRKPSAIPSPEHLQPSSCVERRLSQNTSSQRKASGIVVTQVREASATHKQASPSRVTFTPQPQSTQPRKTSATPETHSPPQPATRKTPCTTKHASPPKPDWIAPPGKYCSPSLSPSPSQIPLPTFVSSARKEGLSSPLQGRDRLYTPASDTRRRKTAVKGSSPLVYPISGGDATDMTGARRSSIEGSKKEIKGLGLTFKDSFSSSDSGLGSEVDLPVSGSGVSSLESAIPRLKSVDVTSPTSPTTPRSRFYIPNAHSTAIAAKDGKSRETNAKEKEQETPKRDSLSPIISPSSTSSFYTSATSFPIPKPINSKIPQLRYRYLSPLPPSPSTAHPYTGNTHITPSCTSGSLTHRLNCGHLF